MCEDDKLLTTGDIERILSVSRETIIEYIKKGELKGYQIERRYYARRSEVEAFIEQRAVVKNKRK